MAFFPRSEKKELFFPSKKYTKNKKIFLPKYDKKGAFWSVQTRHTWAKNENHDESVKREFMVLHRRLQFRPFVHIFSHLRCFFYRIASFRTKPTTYRSNSINLPPNYKSKQARNVEKNVLQLSPPITGIVLSRAPVITQFAEFLSHICTQLMEKLLNFLLAPSPALFTSSQSVWFISIGNGRWDLFLFLAQIGYIIRWFGTALSVFVDKYN